MAEAAPNTSTDLTALNALTATRVQPREYAINKPNSFDGDRKKIDNFIQECQMYFKANSSIYDNDDLKVSFVLSFMNEKEALQWRKSFVRAKTNTNEDIIYPSYKDFLKLLRDYFRPVDGVNQALNKLNILKQGARTAEELVTEFRLLASDAELGDDDGRSDGKFLIQLFRNSLNPRLRDRILLDRDIPKTISDWLDRAIQYDLNFRNAKELSGQNTGQTRAPNYQGRNWGQRTWVPRQQQQQPQSNDPNAMQIDYLSNDERATYMRQGLCFKCKKPGHRARDCPPPSSANQPPKPKKFGPRDINALIGLLSKEEHEELMNIRVNEVNEGF
jgi:hypothetical protein